MSTMPQLRKNIKFFAGGKNTPLVKLAPIVSDGEEVIAVLAMPVGSEFNTCLQLERDLYPTLPLTSGDIPKDKRFKQRNIMYDRIDITQALRIEFVTENDVFIIDKDTRYEQPINVVTFIQVLNEKYGYDMTEDDITITYNDSNNYTITAKPNSLVFFGQASVDFGTEGEVPPIKIPSHDAVWDNAVVSRTTPLVVNGINVDPTSLAVQYNAGIAVVQFDTPDMAWSIWTGALEGEATLTATTNNATVSVANVNETPKVTGNKLFAKYVPFTPNESVPDFTDPIQVADFKQTLFLTFPYLPTLDKLVNVWVDNVKVKMSDLASVNGVSGLKLTMNADGESVINHDGKNDVRLMMRVNVPTLPALVRSNSRFIYGIQRAGNNLPLDPTGREIYKLTFPAEVIIEPKPSRMVPTIANNSNDYIGLLNKVGGGLILPYQAYISTGVRVSTPQENYLLSATIESESMEARFPTFYHISKEDWEVISSQNTNTVLGTYQPNKAVDEFEQITVGYLQASSVETAAGDGRLVCILVDLPNFNKGELKLNFQPGGVLYLNTDTPLEWALIYNRASIITPVSLDKDSLRIMTDGVMTPSEFELMWTRQDETLRYISQLNRQWLINYEFKPWNAPGTATNAIDGDGLYILQMMQIPALALTEISTIALTNPNAVIIKITDTGGLNGQNLTALQIHTQAVVNDQTGNGVILVKHSKRAPTSVQWVFKCDYDGIDPIYRETDTIVNITDSIIDNPVVNFNAIIQECVSKDQYDDYVIKATEALAGPYYSWDKHKLDFNFDDTFGTFTRYGAETPIQRTVGRLIIGPEYRNWLATGDFSQFPDKNPVIIQFTNASNTATYSILADYLKIHANDPQGIPIPLSLFEDTTQPTNWIWTFTWFGKDNPPRPAPSPLPNLKDGSIVTSMTFTTLPFQVETSLFNFTSNFTAQQSQLLRTNLNAAGKDIPMVDAVVKSYYASIQADTPQPPAGNNSQTFTTEWADDSTKHYVMQVIEIDPVILNKFINGTFPGTSGDQVVFTLNRAGNAPALGAKADLKLTVNDIRQRAVVTESQGLIPVLSEIDRVQPFGNPNQGTQQWVGDFTAINHDLVVYQSRTINLRTKVMLSSQTAPVANLKGIKGVEYPVNILTLAVTQWPARSFLAPADLDIVANNNFGTWNVTFLNKGKSGYEVLELSTDAMRLIETAGVLAPTVEIFHLWVKTIDNNEFRQNYTAAQLKAKLGTGNLLVIPMDALVRKGDYDYDISITLNSDVTTVSSPGIVINNKTTVKDNTPPDVTVNASWAVPASNEELATWCALINVPAITLAQYNFTATQYDYVRNVSVEEGFLDYVACIRIEKAVRDRLIENRYPGTTKVGHWNGNDLLASDLIDGFVDENGDSILPIKVKVAVNVDIPHQLSFSISGIADYNKSFTGSDKAIVLASDVIVTKIQNNFDQLLTNLTTALNPVAEQLVSPTTLGATITETTSNIGNVLNDVSRDYIGRKWVIPVGVSKEQIDLLGVGTWIVIRVLNSSAEITVNTTELKQYASEGWTFKDVDEKEYLIYPILFTLEDKNNVVKNPFKLTAGMKVDKFTPWFNNYLRDVTFDYSIKQAEVTAIEVFLPDVSVFNQLAIQKPSMNTDYINPIDFNRQDVINGIDTSIDNLAVQPDVGKFVPMVMRYLTKQLKQAETGINIGNIKTTNYSYDKERDEWVADPNGPVTLELTKPDLETNLVIGEYTYKLLESKYEDLAEHFVTFEVTLDFDGPNSDWLVGQDSYGAILHPAYNVNCVGALEFAGVLDINNVAGSVAVSEEGLKYRITNENDFLTAMRSIFGSNVIELTEYVADPELDD